MSRVLPPVASYAHAQECKAALLNCNYAGSGADHKLSGDVLCASNALLKTRDAQSATVFPTIKTRGDGAARTIRENPTSVCDHEESTASTTAGYCCRGSRRAGRTSAAEGSPGIASTEQIHQERHSTQRHLERLQ